MLYHTLQAGTGPEFADVFSVLSTGNKMIEDVLNHWQTDILEINSSALNYCNANESIDN